MRVLMLLIDASQWIIVKTDPPLWRYNAAYRKSASYCDSSLIDSQITEMVNINRVIIYQKWILTNIFIFNIIKSIRLPVFSYSIECSYLKRDKSLY